MSTPNGRDNGLPPATRYVALVDVDPPVADQVLDLLRDAGVAAIAQPLEGEVGLARDTTPPSRPTDRIVVDSLQLVAAQDIIGRSLPQLRMDFHVDAALRADAEDAAAMQRAAELAPQDVDSLFADIVSQFGTTTSDPVARWSVREDVEPGSDPIDPVEDRPRLSARLVRRSNNPVPPAPYDESEHFIPQPPPPLPETDPITRVAWAGLLGGPGLIVLAALLGLGMEPWMVILALAAFLGGFATLVARMRDSKLEGWDDGSVL
ncbi:MAG: hypothetical protein WCI29_04315 [Actinomycetes bacterium]|jgi:hypothetical protein